MKRVKDSKELLYALTDANDAYIQDAIEFAANKGTKEKGELLFFQRAIKIAGVAAACFILIFAGYHLIGTNQTAEPDVDILTVASPYVVVEEMSEAEALAGFRMELPEAQEPYSKIIITVINGTMIEAAYTTTQDTDTGYYIRKAEGTKDVSGDTNEYAQTELVMVEDISVTLKGDDNSWSVATWSVGGYSYAIGSQDHPMTKEQITALVQKVK